MANNKERRALTTKALAEWRSLNACMLDLHPETASLTGSERFMAVSSSEWGQGAWQCWSALEVYRKCARIMGFYLDLEDLDVLTDNPRAAFRLLPPWMVK